MGEESETVICRPKLKAPEPPTDLKSAGTTKSTVTLQWKQPEDDGGSEITGYILQKRELRRQVWQPVAKVIVDSITSIPN